MTRARMCGTASTWMCVVLSVSAAIVAQARPTWLGLGVGLGLGLGSGLGLGWG